MKCGMNDEAELDNDFVKLVLNKLEDLFADDMYEEDFNDNAYLKVLSGI